ncbi:MAG: hypothetical protein PHW84_08835, partial [Methanosarcina sp.]|nr:hypothetical protein [Methanosarcina sp.]
RRNGCGVTFGFEILIPKPYPAWSTGATVARKLWGKLCILGQVMYTGCLKTIPDHTFESETRNLYLFYKT